AITNDGSTVYWLDLIAGGGAIHYADIATQTVKTLPIAPTSFVGPTGIAVDATYVYWSNKGTSVGTSSIYRANKTDGSGVTSLITSGTVSAIQSMAIDSTSIYYTSIYGGQPYTVGSIPIGGGPTTTIAASEQFPLSVAADGTAIYWTDQNRLRK